MTHDVSTLASRTPKVAILMCTYQGEAFLAEQLASLERQSCTDWSLHVSDDGSTDATWSMLQAFRQRHAGRVTLWRGPQRGFAANFMSLLCNPEVRGCYFAFCDQDDVWCPDRLERGLAALEGLPECDAALYCSRTQLIDAEGRPIGLSALPRRAPSFRNALVQCLASGNTMLLNAATRQLLRRVPVDLPVASHDWLAYMLVTGSGGHVVYDSQPSVFYRQHSNNQVGTNIGVVAKLVRAQLMLAGRFREWTGCNVLVLEHCADVLKADNLHRFECFRSARNSFFLRRMLLLIKAGVHRQTVMGSTALMLAATFNRV